MLSEGLANTAPIAAIAAIVEAQSVLMIAEVIRGSQIAKFSVVFPAQIKSGRFLTKSVGNFADYSKATGRYKFDDCVVSDNTKPSGS
jgi:hypothetical protein